MSVDAIPFPVPEHLRDDARPEMELAMEGLPAEARREYRALLAEESAVGHVAGDVPPALRALDRLLQRAAERGSEQRA